MKKLIFSVAILLVLSTESMAGIGTYGVREANTFTYVLEGSNCSMMPTNVRKGLLGNQYTQPTNHAIILFTSNGKYPLFKNESDCLAYVKHTQ